jgi:hypothetical protein
VYKSKWDKYFFVICIFFIFPVHAFYNYSLISFHIIIPTCVTESNVSYSKYFLHNIVHTFTNVYLRRSNVLDYNDANLNNFTVLLFMFVYFSITILNIKFSISNHMVLYYTLKIICYVRNVKSFAYMFHTDTWFDFWLYRFTPFLHFVLIPIFSRMTSAWSQILMPLELLVTKDGTVLGQFYGLPTMNYLKRY